MNAEKQENDEGYLNFEVLEGSFNALEPVGEALAEKFYETLFDRHPDIAPLFSNVSIEEQNKKLWAALQMVVGELRNPSSLTEVLQNLGKRHVKYGVVAEHYPLVSSTLIDTMREFSGELWTEEVELAWTNALTTIANVMSKASSEDSTMKINASEASKGNAIDNIFESALNGAMTPMMMIDRDFIITYLNQSTIDLLSKHQDTLRTIFPGFDATKLCGQSVDQFHKNPSHQRLLLSEPNNLPYRTDIAVGPLQFSLNITAVVDDSGTYKGNFLEWMDVTELRASEVKNADYGGQVDAISKSQAVIEFNLDGTVITANDNFLNTLGYTLAEIQGQHHSMFVESGCRDSLEYRQFWDKLNRGEYEAGEYKRLGKNGKEVWIQASYNAILDVNQKPYKVVKYATDVTEQKMKSADLAGQLEAIGKLQAVIEFNMDGTIITANENFLNTVGYRLADIQGQHHSIFVESNYRESQEYRLFWEKLNRGEYDSAEYLRIGQGGKEIWIQASYNPIFDLNGNPFKVVKYAVDITQQKNAEKQIDSLINAASKGDLSERIDVSDYSDFLKSLGDGINTLIDAVMEPVHENNRVVSALSEGDLREKMTGDFEGEYKVMQDSLNKTVGNLRKMVGDIQSSAGSIVSAAGEIAEGNTDLSQRTEEQASSLQETASSMEELTSTVRQNADNARQANQLASGARDQAEKGGDVVQKAVVAMSEINASSKRIADIIGVIDEIAFQTNLLALNAAVEAARAGEQGRGFAVVAGEVRNLAQRSAGAAKEIKTLIQDSVEKVDDGSRLVDQSGKTLEEIVGSVKKVSDIIAEIAAASQEQSSGIEQVNKAVTQMDEVTQQNAALVEQAAAASESMDEQAKGLQKMMNFFQS